MQSISDALKKLENSKFRSSFHLKEKERDYIRKKGLDVIREHAKDIIKKRLAPAYIENDGNQTPTKNHPVFIAQHACACCCRSCLYKLYKVPQGIELSEERQEKIVSLLMAWIEKEYTSCDNVS